MLRDNFKVKFFYYNFQASLMSSLLVSGCACLIASCLPAHLASLQTAFFLIGNRLFLPYSVSIIFTA
jgi:hypothetical protein